MWCIRWMVRWFRWHGTVELCPQFLRLMRITEAVIMHSMACSSTIVKSYCGSQDSAMDLLPLYRRLRVAWCNLKWSAAWFIFEKSPWESQIACTTFTSRPATFGLLRHKRRPSLHSYMIMPFNTMTNKNMMHPQSSAPFATHRLNHVYSQQ